LVGDADPEVGVVVGVPPVPPPLVGLAVGLVVGEGWEEPPPLVGVAVGDAVAVGLGEVSITGGTTPGATGPLADRSCCHDQATDPPAGTVSAPTLEDEYVHDAFEPSAHHSPQ
jgi:hypothetical protein